MRKMTIDEEIEDAEKKRKMYLELAYQQDMRHERLLKKKYPIKNGKSTLASFHS